MVNSVDLHVGLVNVITLKEVIQGEWERERKREKARNKIEVGYTHNVGVMLDEVLAT